jgi:hypothetical protein
MMVLYENMESPTKSRSRVLFMVSIAFVLGALLVGLLENSSSLIQTSKTVPSGGSVKGVGVGIYWDNMCTNTASSINWGVLDPGSNKTVTVYIRNEGNAVATLSEATQNWDPSSASSYLTLNWNYAGQTMSVNQVLQVKLTLTVSPTISEITGFSFDIIITAMG